MARSSDKAPARSAALAQIAAVAALACAAVLAVSVRLFSVVKYESVIHEFDPYFNFREWGFSFTLVETRDSSRFLCSPRGGRGQRKRREEAERTDEARQGKGIEKEASIARVRERMLSLSSSLASPLSLAFALSACSEVKLRRRWTSSSSAHSSSNRHRGRVEENS